MRDWTGYRFTFTNGAWVECVGWDGLSRYECSDSEGNSMYITEDGIFRMMLVPKVAVTKTKRQCLKEFFDNE